MVQTCPITLDEITATRGIFVKSIDGTCYCVTSIAELTNESLTACPMSRADCCQYWELALLNAELVQQIIGAEDHQALNTIFNDNLNFFSEGSVHSFDGARPAGRLDDDLGDEVVHFSGRLFPVDTAERAATNRRSIYSRVSAIPTTSPEQVRTSRRAALISSRERSFSQTNFSDVDVSGLDLSSFRFIGSDFQGCVFRGSTITGVNFSQAELSGARFLGASAGDLDLRGARGVDHTDLHQVDLRGSKICTQVYRDLYALGKRDFQLMDLQEVDFSQVSMQGVSFKDSTVNYIGLMSVDLWSVKIDVMQFLLLYRQGRRDFNGVELMDADFLSKNLTGVIFENANLEGANFGGCVLAGADFSGANLLVADFSDSYLRDVKVDQDTRIWAQSTVLEKQKFERFMAIYNGLFRAQASFFKRSRIDKIQKSGASEHHQRLLVIQHIQSHPNSRAAKAFALLSQRDASAQDAVIADAQLMNSICDQARRDSFWFTPARSEQIAAVSEELNVQSDDIVGSPLVIRPVAETRDYDYLFKLVLMSSYAVGSSCLLHRYATGLYRQQPITIGVEFETKITQAFGRNIKLQIWDTAGQERFRAVTRSYYRNAMVLLVLYDMSKSFRPEAQRLRESIESARAVESDALIYLVGTKKDLVNQRAVSLEGVNDFARENRIDGVFECSAVTGEGVEEIFNTAARDCLRNVTDRHHVVRQRA